MSTVLDLSANERVTIRPYVPSDWDRLCIIHDAARLDELRLSAGEAAFLTLEQTAVSEGLFASKVAVALVNGEIQGFIAYSSNEITWLYVAPPAYRQGIGRTLLRHALLESSGPVTVQVLEGNTPAIDLYIAEGFSVSQRIVGRLEGNEAFAATGLVLRYG